MEEQKASIKKMSKDYEINAYLAKEKVISPKEFFDTKIQQARMDAENKIKRAEQMNDWQQDLLKYRSDLSEYHQQASQLELNAGYYEIRAPISGYVQGINSRLPGSLLGVNESICSISPDTTMIAECYVSSKDIGLIKKFQTVYFHVDAFNFNYFGQLTGKVLSIDNDYSIIGSSPGFKVRCSFDSAQSHINKSFYYKLKKGLTLQARFLIDRRALWELLFNKLRDSINPA